MTITKELNTQVMRVSWLIRIQGYGTFEFYGTEEEAEEMRRHKSQWEGGVGMKWRKELPLESDRVSAEIAARFDLGQGVPAGLMKRLRRAREKEKEKKQGGEEEPCI